MNCTFHSKLIFSSVLAIALFSLSLPAQAVSIHVTAPNPPGARQADVLANDGKCSLREAIESANRNASYLPGQTPLEGECEIGSATETDEILMPAGSFTFINGVDSDLLISENLSLFGTKNAISGRPDTFLRADLAGYIFRIQENVSVHFKDLEFVEGKGNDGGCIFNQGLLTGENLRFYSCEALNTGGAIQNNGNLSLQEAYFQGNKGPAGGGAIQNSGNASIELTTFLGNTSRNGGALDNDGTMLVSTSSFDANFNPIGSPYLSGAIFNRKTMEIVSSLFKNHSTGAILSQSGDETLSIYRSSFFKNTGGDTAGAIHSRGKLEINNTTFTKNRGMIAGALYVDHSLATVKNSTFTANSATQNQNALANEIAVNVALRGDRHLDLFGTIVDGSCSGDIRSLGYNLLSDQGCVERENRVASDISGDPLFLPYDTNTYSYMLADNSPTINAIPNESCARENQAILPDQIGTPRPIANACDIGAREMGCANSVLQEGEQCDDGNTTNGDGCSNACVRESSFVCEGSPSTCTFQDEDEDGLGDEDDNCPALANADQADLDGDLIGDVCDEDRDGDGVKNELDDCPEDDDLSCNAAADPNANDANNGNNAGGNNGGGNNNAVAGGNNAAAAGSSGGGCSLILR